MNKFVEPEILEVTRKITGLVFDNGHFVRVGMKIVGGTVKAIFQHHARGEGDRWYWQIQFEENDDILEVNDAVQVVWKGNE